MRLVMAGWVVLACSTCALAQCRAARYHEGRVWEDSEASAFMAVSIPLHDFAPARLVCLAEALRLRYHYARTIDVLIFSSAYVADRYAGNVPSSAPAKNSKRGGPQSFSFWVRQLHGFYSYNADTHEEYVELRPFGADVGGGPYDTRIDLPVTGIPRCRLEFSGRCVLALDPIYYPDEALTQGISGGVLLAGLISKSGEIRNIKISETSVKPLGQSQILADDAVRNLKTWRLEAARREEPIQIKYSYVIDPSLPMPQGYRRQVESQLALPNQVTIRGRILQ